MSIGGALLPAALRDALRGAIDGSQPAWQKFVEANREQPGSTGLPLAMKYLDSQWTTTYRQANKGLHIGHSYHTWGRGVYVTGVEDPLSTAIYGRVGVIARFDPDGWRCFDARHGPNRQLYLSWLQAQPNYPQAVLTVHSNHWLHSFRNLFREQFAIDVVLFEPDELDNAGHYTTQSDTWLAVSDWNANGTLAQGYSKRFIDARVSLVVEEEFRASDPGLTRSALLQINSAPPSAASVATQARAAYANQLIDRVQS